MEGEMCAGLVPARRHRRTNSATRSTARHAERLLVRSPRAPSRPGSNRPAVSLPSSDPCRSVEPRVGRGSARSDGESQSRHDLSSRLCCCVANASPWPLDRLVLTSRSRRQRVHREAHLSLLCTMSPAQCSRPLTIQSASPPEQDMFG